MKTMKFYTHLLPQLTVLIFTHPQVLLFHKSVDMKQFLGYNYKGSVVTYSAGLGFKRHLAVLFALNVPDPQIVFNDKFGLQAVPEKRGRYNVSSKFKTADSQRRTRLWR